MKYVKIHKEGKLIIAITLTILFLLNMWVYMKFPNIILAVTQTLSALLLLFFMFFFRNPRRVVEIDDPSLIIAPADGNIVVIEPTEEMEYFGDKRIQVSIFMSLFNVHANWYPVAGKVIKTAHHSGRHMAAYLPKASSENERSTIIIETPGKTQILVRQIAGALARRIVTYAHVGKSCHLNEHIGFIKFGSRVDMFLPLDAEIFVTIGESTTGNETIIARLNEQ